jgi:protein-tyrosine-phosphatase/predicted ATP-grasp superfamily ATP-dependent carboligase
MMNPVLVLGAEPRIAVTIARSLHRHAIAVDVAVLSEDEPVLFSRAIRQFLRFPRPPGDSTEFLQRMQEQIQTNGYDVLIPCSDSTLVACMSHYHELSRLLHVACPPPIITQRVLSKLSTLQIAQQCAISVPKTYPLLSLEDVEAAQAILQFPLIAKPKEKFHPGTFKTRRFQTAVELAKAFLENPEFGARNLIQECCTGAGLGVEVLFHHGEAVAAFQHRRLKELPATGGVSVLAIAEKIDPHLLDQSIRLLRALEWEGVAMVEFLFDAVTGTATLMEVNGRYWGSLPLAVHAGVDFPYWHWQVIHGQTPDVSFPHRISLRARWLCGDFQRLHGVFFPSSRTATLPQDRWKELLRFISDFRPSTREMLWSWRDPVPAVAEITRELRHIAAAHVKSVASRAIPSSLKRWLLIRRQLGPAAGSIYQRRQIARCLRLIRDRSPRLPIDVRTIVFVCHGNIIRSPMAAALLRKLLGEPAHLSVISAGLSVKAGKPADPRASAAAANFGISLEEHRAKPFTSELAKQADLILVMDFDNEAVLLNRFPQARRNTFLLGAFPFGPPSNSLEIRDPYDGELADVQLCFKRLHDHIRGLAALLSRSSP